MGRIYNPDDFIMQYPGVYEGAAKKGMEKYFAMINEINNTQVSVEDIVAGRVAAPKLGGVLEVTEAMMKFQANKYAPDFKPLFDAECAKAYGYKDIYAMPCFGSCDDTNTQPTPPEARDTLLVSQICHEVECVNPIYPGDTLYMIRDKVEVTDLTPESGSLYRHLYQKDYGTTYNQHGEVVCKVCFGTMESVKIYKDDCLPKPRAEMGFGDMWEDPDWLSRPAHVYTDEDYEYIKSIWANECNQSEVPLYWEDVNVGDQPAPSAYGPILEGVTPMQPYGMGIDGCRSLKKEIMDPETFKTLARDEKTGIWASPDHEVNCPTTPDGKCAPKQPDGMPGGAAAEGGEINTSDIHKAGADRSALINFFTRDIALGHVMNYIGYHGKVRRVRWSIMPADVHTAMGKPVPVAPGYEIFTRRIPGMENSTMPAHGLTTDLVVIKSQVTDKFIVNDRHMVSIVFWAETIEGDAWETGVVEVELPSKNQ